MRLISRLGHRMGPHRDGRAYISVHNTAHLGTNESNHVQIKLDTYTVMRTSIVFRVQFQFVASVFCAIKRQ